MKLRVTKVPTWVATIHDRPGSLAMKLEDLALAGANLQFIMARRTREQPGGFVWVAGLKGAKQIRAARAAGFTQTEDLHALRVEGPDHKGLAFRVTRAVADAGVNMRGLTAAGAGKLAVMHLAFDSTADANKALRALSVVH